MKRTKIFAVLITLVMIFSSFIACADFTPVRDFIPQYPEYGNYPQGTPNYSERVYVEPDKEAIEKLRQEIMEKANDGVTTYRQILALREDFYVHYNQVITSTRIAQFEFYRDYSNEELSKRSQEIFSYANELNNKTIELEKVLFTSQHKDRMIKDLGQEYYDMIMREEVKDEETLNVENRINTLVTEYESTEPVYANYDKLANIYIDLVNERNAYARKLLKPDGETYYANYLEYAYLNTFGRSYTPDEVADFRSYVYELLVPVSYYTYGNMSNAYLVDKAINADVLKSIIPEIIKNTAPQMINSWDYMMQKGLYDFDILDNKLNSAFVAEITNYDDGFMFIGNPSSLVHSTSTVIHEFGHYNEIFAKDKNKEGNGSSNYDLLETHSQAFELITLPAVENVIKKKYGNSYKNSYVFNLILNFIWSSLFNSAVDEFEYIVYTADSETLTPSFISKTFKDCYKKYWPHDNSYSFYQVSHIYTDPAYCISYAVSAIFSAEIWTQENNVEVYLDVVSYGGSNSLQTVYEAIGIPSPLEKESIEQIANYYMQYLHNTFGWKLPA